MKASSGFMLPIKHDVKYIQNLGFSMDYVPKVGEKLFCRNEEAFSLGGISWDVTEESHPLMIALAERAATTVGVRLCGVDIITKNHKDFDKAFPPVIIELNTCPGLDVHCQVMNVEKKKDVITPILNTMLKKN